MAALFGIVTACEAIVGADFDSKTLAAPAGAAGAGGEGGSLAEAGTPCSEASACQSGFCSHGRCCEADCAEGACRRCDLPGEEGSCRPLAYGAACPDIPDGVCDGAAFCATGDHRWSARFGATGRESAVACGFSSSGDLWVAGNFDQSIRFGPAATELVADFVDQRVFVARFDEAGDHLWSTALGDNDPLSSTFELSDAAVGPAGGIALVGHLDGAIHTGGATIESSSAQAETIFLLVLDAHGSYRWHHTYAGDDFSALGDSGKLRVAYGANGRVAVVASFAGAADLGDGQGPLAPTTPVAAFVAAHDANGALVFTSRLDGPAQPLVFVRDVAFAPTGEVVVTGFFEDADIVVERTVVPWLWGASAEVSSDVFLAVFAPEGGIVDAKSYGNAARQLPTALATSPDGHVLLAGTFAGEIDFGGGVVTNQNVQPGIESDGFFAKISIPAVDDVWPAKAIGPSGQLGGTLANIVAADSFSNAVVAGRAFDGMSFDGQALPSGVFASFVGKVNALGQPLWVQSFGIEDSQPIPADAQRLHLADVSLGPAGAIGLCGFTTDTVSFGGEPLASAGDRDVIVAVFEP